MCLAWTTPASLVETVACQGQQRYLAKHQLRPPKCRVSWGPVHPQTWLRQGRICCRSQMQSLQALQLSWMFCVALNCYMAIPLLPTMSFRCLRGSRFCSSCSSSSSSCGWTDRDSGERGDGGAEAPGTFFSPSTWEVVNLTKARKMKLLGRLKSVRIGMIGVGNVFFLKTWPTWKLCFVRWCNRQDCWTI